MLIDESKHFVERGTPSFQIKVWEPLPHVFHLAGKFLPEAKQGITEIADFFKKQVEPTTVASDGEFELVD